MTPTKYIFRAGFQHLNHPHQNPTFITIVAADFSEALKKAADAAGIAGGKEDPVELVQIKRGESIDVE